jgi:hypothetical protein
MGFKMHDLKGNIFINPTKRNAWTTFEFMTESNRLYDTQIGLDPSNVIKDPSRSHHLLHSLSGAWPSWFLEEQRQGREPKSYLELEAAIRVQDSY